MRKILRMLKPFVGTLILSIIFSAFNSILDMVIPIYTKYILSDGIIPKNMNNILKFGLIMLGMTVLSMVASVLNTYFSTKTSVNYAMNIRNHVFKKVSRLSQNDVDKIGVSSLMTRTTHDVRQVHEIILNSLKSVLPVPIYFIGGLYMANQVNHKLMKLIFVVVPILLLIVVVVFIFIMPMFTKVQKLLDKMNFVLRGKIGGIRVIRAFNKSDYEDERFDETNRALTKLTLKANRILSSLIPVITVVLYSLICYIIYMCISEAAVPGNTKKQILDTIPNMYMFISYFSLVILAMSTVVTIVISFPKAAVSARRINAILDSVPDIKDSENPKVPDENIKGSLEFENVSFKYKPEEPKKTRTQKIISKLQKKSKELEKKSKSNNPPENDDKTIEDEKKTEEKPAVIPFDDGTNRKKYDEDAVEDISFKSKSGEVTAIIGITGSGKTTLVNLIPRLYDVTEGRILLDGVDIRDMSLSELHKRIAYVPQQSYLFSGTVKDNIKFGNPDASDSEVWKAVEIAQAKTFVTNMSDGIDSFVSQAGKNYSGGQKQRLAIARAVIKEAEIYIFDDSFSALDLATDARLRASLREYLPNANIIIVAQRVGTVINADRIIVMDDGRAVGVGTHKELLDNCPVYRKIVESQLTEEEVEATV